jgi:hypothetical protein
MPEKTYEKFDYKKIEPGAGSQKVILRFDNPQEGDSEYGHWILYGVTVNGIDSSWFVGKELKDLFTSLKLKRGAELLIHTGYYTNHDKNDEPFPDIYGILEYKGKEYSFGKQENGEKKESQSTPETELKPEPDQELKARLDKLDALYEETTINLGADSVVRMIDTLFMSKAKVV